MTALRTTWQWTGFSGAPGYTTFVTSDSGLIQTAVDNSVSGQHDFWAACAPALAAGCTISLFGDVERFDEATGDLVSLHSPSSAPGSVGGGGSGVGPSPAGACISWGTGGVHNGRRVRGRTFLVPIALNVFQSDGSLTPGSVTIFNDAAEDYRTSAAYETLIWARPRTGLAGATFPITSSNCPDKVAVLRSRRD